MEKIVLIIKGFFIGIANIIPGVSGGTLMISLGVFEEIIDSISNFFGNMKKSTIFLFWILLGAGLSLVLMSRVVTYSLEHFHWPTILFFVGLIIGGIPMLFKTVKKDLKNYKNIIIFLITFSIVLVMTFFEGGIKPVDFNNLNIISYIILVIIGIVAAASMVVPGISGSFMLVLLGYYEPILNSIKELTSFENIFTNIVVLGFFGVGVLVGIILVAKLIKYLLDKFEVPTYFGILGFVFSSIISIIATALGTGITITVLQVLIAIPLFFMGMYTSLKLGD